jgi:succinoglycan biosynthesis transport protein ExoP
MDLRRQGQLVRTWLWLLIAGVLLAGGSAYLVSISLPKVYEAQATLLVGESSSSSGININDLLASQRISQTYANLATTGPILQQVIADAGLTTTPEEFRKLVTATAARDSTLVTVNVKDGNPQQAADLANAIADQMIAASGTVYGRNGQVQDFIAGQVAATQAQIEETQAEIDRLTGLPSRTATQDQQLATLKSQAANLRQSYAALVGLAGSAANAITVVDPATPPALPSSPRVLLNTLIAAIVGLLIALGIAFALEYLDDTVKSSKDVEEATGLPTLGTIVKMKTEKGRKEIYHLATLVYPRGPAAEAYRTLRTNLAFASVDEPVRTLLVTSSIPGEGKTTTSGNLAVAFAQADRRVILLDADLRKPGIDKLFDLPNAKGLTTLLADDEATVESVTQTMDQVNLRIVTTGPLPPNPAELLGSQRMRGILERLAADADLVIVDSPPLQAVTDAAILASITDGTLLVIDSGRTRRAATQHGREALAKADARVLGAALNRMSSRSGNEYVYYDYYGAKDKEGAAVADTAAAGASAAGAGAAGASAASASSASAAKGSLTEPRG